MYKDPFKEYIKQSEPDKRDKGYAWHTAIGLQAVDGLKTSEYLIDTAIKNIEGDISMEEVQEILNATNDIFAENAWYFRNALVRANYNDLKNDVHETTEYLELFLRNLLLDEKNELHNRSMHISKVFAEVDIADTKVDIGNVKVDIESKLKAFSNNISEKTISHAVEIFLKCGRDTYFGRTVVEEITGLKSSGASKLIKLLFDSEVIIPVTGHGKGKYRFK